MPTSSLSRKVNALAKRKQPYELDGEALAAYRTGFHDGNESNYFPGGIKHEVEYAWGYRDGQTHGDRKGKPWTLEELLKLARKS